MEGLLYVGKVINKTKKNYQTKDGTEGTEYNIKLAVFGASLLVRANQEVFEKLEESKTYTLPVGVRVFAYSKDGENKAGASWYVRNGDIIDNETGEVIELAK